MSSELTLQINKEWLRDNVKVREIMAAESGDMEAIVSILARGMASPHTGEYVGEEAGKDHLLDLSMGEFTDLMTNLRKELESAAVP